MRAPDGYRRVALDAYAPAGTPALEGAVWYQGPGGVATEWSYSETEAIERAWALKERLERMLNTAQQEDKAA